MVQRSQQRERLLPSSKSRNTDMMVGIPFIDFQEPESVAIEQAMSLIAGLVACETVQAFSLTVQLAISAFDEEASCFHNQLVDCGVGLVLTRCLIRSLSREDRLLEIDGICKLLMLFFRCSNDLATKTLQSLVGELYPLLLAILLMKTKVPTWVVPDSMFRLIERLSSLPIKLHQIDQKDYIFEVFQEAITICKIHPVEKEVVSAVFQLLTGTVLNMNSRHHILALPSFVPDIVTSINSFRKASYHVAAFFLVAAQDRESRLVMVETKGFIPVLSLLLKDESTTVRKVAIALVKVIAVDSKGRTVLLTFGSSKLLNSLFECAKKGVIEEDCLESIRYLISSDTAKTLCEEERLLEQILPDNTFDSTSTQHDIIVAKIIYRMSSFLFVNGKGMSRFVDVILQLTASTCPKVRYWGVKALAKQTKIEACSFFLIHTPTVANIVAKTLANLVGDEDPDVQKIVVSMIVDLSSNPLNHRPLTKNAALLTSLAAQIGKNCSKAAVLTFLNLASSEKMRGVLAKTHNLAASLCKFGLLPNNEDNDELKKGALQCVIWLVPLM